MLWIDMRFRLINQFWSLVANTFYQSIWVFDWSINMFICVLTIKELDKHLNTKHETNSHICKIWYKIDKKPGVPWTLQEHCREPVLVPVATCHAFLQTLVDFGWVLPDFRSVLVDFVGFWVNLVREFAFGLRFGDFGPKWLISCKYRRCSSERDWN